MERAAWNAESPSALHSAYYIPAGGRLPVPREHVLGECGKRVALGARREGVEQILPRPAGKVIGLLEGVVHGAVVDEAGGDLLPPLGRDLAFAHDAVDHLA